MALYVVISLAFHRLSVVNARADLPQLAVNTHIKQFKNMAFVVVYLWESAVYHVADLVGDMDMILFLDITNQYGKIKDNIYEYKKDLKL